MKKIFFGFLACAALFVGLTSCNNDVDDPSSKDEVKLGPVRIVIGCQSEDTKVYYNDVITESNVIHLQPYWEEGDNVLVIDEDGKAYDLQITSILENGTDAVVEGMCTMNTTVQMVYKRGLSTAAWVEKENSIPVDFSEQEISYNDNDGKYHINPVVLAGAVKIDENGHGSGQLNYQCGIVKVSAVRGVPAGQTITKISLWGDKIARGEYRYDTSTKKLVYTTPVGEKVDGCQELKVENPNGVVDYDDDAKLANYVYFAVPTGATLKQATVTTKVENDEGEVINGSLYFHNIKPVINETTGQVTRLGVRIKARDYYNIEEFEEYYFTVHDYPLGDELYSPVKNAQKIHLAPGNLYASGIKWTNYEKGSSEKLGIADGSDVTFHFEENQWDYRNIPNAENDESFIKGIKYNSTPDGTCGNFLWSGWEDTGKGILNGSNAYSKMSHPHYGPSSIKYPTNNCGFWTNDVGFRVQGQPEEYKWRTLTFHETQYLLKIRLLIEATNTGNGNTFEFTQINGVNGCLIFHDNYLGPKKLSNKSLDYIPDGCAFLPAAGCRESMVVDPNETANDGSYWTCSLFDNQTAWVLLFFRQGGDSANSFDIHNSNGRPIRLARNLPGPANQTTE